jgi:UDP-3-O-[3-hydroxymyristoyl] N-acetylglucosamine deacetylase
VRFVADFPEPIGTEYFYGEIDAASYRKEIAAARTFGYLHEVEDLRARGLALGGSLENAIVFAPTGPMQPLRWSNEVVRHKVLDLIGDLALAGRRIEGKVVAERAGHFMHTTLVSRLLKDRSAWELARVPVAGAASEEPEKVHVAVRRPALIGA